MIYVMITVFLFALDSVIKHKIEKNTESGVIKEMLNKKIIIRKYHNTGAMLEAFSKNQHAVAKVSLAVASFISGIFVAILILVLGELIYIKEKVRINRFVKRKLEDFKDMKKRINQEV